MRSAILFLIANSLCTSLALAENQRLRNFPVLGYVEGNLLYVPTYQEQHANIPDQLFAYGSGREFVATLRKKGSFIALDGGRECRTAWVGQYVYETQPATETVRVIVFDEKKNIQSSDAKMTEPASHAEWEIFSLASNEGGHDILRTQRNGKCIGHIDYYTHCDYDTEADSGQAFQAAMCGEKIYESDAGF